jgi:AcrR family transcriptional regulator
MNDEEATNAGIQALAQLIGKRGFRRLTTEELQSQSAIPDTQFQRLFGDKFGALNGAMSAMRARLLAFETAAGQVKVLGFIAEYLGHVEAHPALYRQTFAEGEEHLHVVLQATLADVFHGHVQKTVAAERLGGKSRAASELMAGGLIGLLKWWITVAPGLSATEVGELYVALSPDLA